LAILLVLKTKINIANKLKEYLILAVLLVVKRDYK